MKRPVLTEAMRRFLESLRDGSNYTPTERTYREAYEAGFTSPGGGQLTPRGQAALAAPSVTAAEYDLMQRIERSRNLGLYLCVHGRHRRVYMQLIRKGLADDSNGGEFTPAGTTALNNIRAASGSPEWKP